MSATKKSANTLRRQQGTHRLLRRYHPSIGQLYVPHIRARVPFEGGGFYVKTNRLGFRSDWEFSAGRRARPRILFFGDSFTAGYGVDNAQRYPERLGQLTGAEIYNFGVSGTGTDQQLLVYETFARDITADLIVIGVMVENIERNKEAYHPTIDSLTGDLLHLPKPYFTLQNDELSLHNSPVPRYQLGRENLKEEVDVTAVSAADRLLYGLRSLYYSDQLSFLRANKSRQTSPLNSRFLQLAGFQPYPDYKSGSSRGWQLMAAILRRFLGQALPTPVVIMPIPDSYYIREQPLKPIYQRLFASLANPAKNIHVLDLTAHLNGLPSSERQRLTFRSDAHFSPRGNELVAKFLTHELQARELLSEVTAKTIATGVSTRKTDYILGISCFYHNSAACLLRDGEIVAAAEEERFSRIKHDRNFPRRAINYCLEEAGIQQNDLAAIVYYDNAYQTFERLMHTQMSLGPAGRAGWHRVLPSWLNYKLHIPTLIRQRLSYSGPLLHDSHHRSHAASAFYPSPFTEAAILTIDGVGEWATATIGKGHGANVEILQEMHFPHSVGLLYSAFTQFIGFKVNNGEYKMMGLAPYGDPIYTDLILENLVDLKADGSIQLNLDYFDFLASAQMTNKRFADLFGGPPRRPEAPITQREMDIASSIQVVIEMIVMAMAHHAHELTGQRKLCLAGGVALNCVANGLLLREGPFEEIWIQPAAGDAGCALGAALDVWHTYYQKPRRLRPDNQPQQLGSYWGPGYSAVEIKALLESRGYPYHPIPDGERGDLIATIIASGKVVGHFSGRLEFGPRALGARSILGDARNEETQTTINLKIKYRESFRPFAPTVLQEHCSDYFELEQPSPYMLIVAPVRSELRRSYRRDPEMDIFAIVRQPRSNVPAITHVDYSARVQSIQESYHPEYYGVISAFRRQTGVGLVVNTSFNVRGEPIVCTPYDAYRCFMRTEMDILVLGDYILYKEEQPSWPEEKGHLEKYDTKGPASLTLDDAGRALDKLFRQSFLPIVAQHASNRICAAQTSTTSRWLPHQAPVGPALFELPTELDRPGGDPVAAAAAITGYWQTGPLSQALRPVVAELLRLSATHYPLDADGAPEEAVPEFIYAMY